MFVWHLGPEPLEDGADMPGRESSLSGLGAYNDERAAQADARFATAENMFARSTARLARMTGIDDSLAPLEILEAAERARTSGASARSCSPWPAPHRYASTLSPASIAPRP